jgi:hypothetical protein
LPDGYNTLLVKASSRNEILADKLLAVPARNNIKARDLWDILWLQQQNETVDVNLLKKKIADHGMANYKTRLENRINEIPGYFEGSVFQKEMSRFLDSNRLKETVLKPEFITYANTTVLQTLGDLHQSLYSGQDNESSFKL